MQNGKIIFWYNICYNNDHNFSLLIIIFSFKITLATMAINEDIYLFVKMFLIGTTGTPAAAPQR